jgi:large subunit ribosomal protein L16
MLQPKRQKYRKSFRGRMRGLSFKGASLEFGDYGLKALECGWIPSRRLEAARKAVSHETKRGGRLWIRVFPDKSYTHKAAGVRMGSGKGEIEGYVAVIRPGRIIMELGGVTESVARESFRLAGRKLGLTTKFVAKYDRS